MSIYMNNSEDSNNLIFIQGNLYPYDLGGHEVFNFYFYKELKKYFNVKVLSNYKRPNEISKSDYLKITNLKPLVLFFPLFAFIKLLKLLKFLKPKPTVILTFSRSSWINWWPYPILNKIFKLNYIIIIHGGGLSKWKWKYPFLKLFQKATDVIGISDRICTEYSNRTGVNIKQLLPLIPFEKSLIEKEKLKNKWNIKKEEKIFLIVGSIKPLKNPDTVVSAAEILGIEFLKENKIKFVFAGNGILLPEIKSRVEMLKFENYFKFLGNIPRNLISEIYGMSDVYIINSDFEGTPLSLLEAIYNKLSIIAADSPGINNVIKHGFNGDLYKTKDPKELAKSIKASLSINNILIENATQTLEKDFDYDKMINEYKLIFKR